MTNRCNQSKGSDPQDGPAVRNTKFCLCGRDPSSAEVRKELIKAMALSLRYDLVQGGCLENAAAAFDKIFANLVPDEARNLERLMQDIDGSLEGQSVKLASSGKAVSRKEWLH